MGQRQRNWLHLFQNNPQASMRLFCFPHAGGAASFFRMWHQWLPDSIEVCPIQLPGRWERIHEPAFRSLEALMEAMTNPLQDYMDKPFALFGHSLGALIAYELVRKIQKVSDGLRLIHLFISSRRAPHVPAPQPYLHLLPDDQLLTSLSGRSADHKAGGRQNLHMQKAFLSVIRNDYEMGETYTYSPGPLLSIPLTVFGGLQDPRLSIEQLQAWQAYTDKSFSIQMFEGKHFYIQNLEKEVIKVIAEKLSR